MSVLLEAARRYHALGWAVVPLHTPSARGCSCRKAARCPSAGKHPRLEWKGYQHRRPSAVELERWWCEWPDANLGVLTGVISGLVVLDVDARSGGLETLHELDARGLWMPDDNPLVATGGRGLHHYVRLDRPLPKCAPFDGIELQADGGLVVAPPSLHVSGRRYEWLRAPGPSPLPPIPRWLRRCAEAVLRDDHPAPRVPPPSAATDNILGAVQAAGIYRRPHPHRRGHHYVMCPWAAEHSNEDPEALLIEPAAVGSERGWGFVCLHAHCADRHLGALLDWLHLPRRRP